MSAAEAETAEGVEPVDTATGEIHRPTVLMSEDEARKITAEIKAWAGTLWLKLKEARDGQAWRAMGYSSWRAYIDGEFDIAKSQSYRLLTHADAVYALADAAGTEVSPMGDTFSERATRGLDIDEVCEAVRTAVMDLPKDATTATRIGLVEAIVAKLKPAPTVEAPKPPIAEPEKSNEDRLAEAMTKAAAEANKAAGRKAAENEASATDASPSVSDEPQQVPAPAAAPDPGKAGAPESRAAATGSTGASSAGAGDGGGTGDLPPTPPAETPSLPADWRDLIGHATYLLRLDAAQVAAAATADDDADLCALTEWCFQYVQAKEQNA